MTNKFKKIVKIDSIEDKVIRFKIFIYDEISSLKKENLRIYDNDYTIESYDKKYLKNEYYLSLNFSSSFMFNEFKNLLNEKKIKIGKLISYRYLDAKEKNKIFKNENKFRFKDKVFYIDKYLVSKIIEKSLNKKYINHRIYTSDDLSDSSIYLPREEIKMIGYFNLNDSPCPTLSIYCLPSIILDVNTNKYKVQQPEYWRGFNFIGLISEGDKICEENIIKKDIEEILSIQNSKVEILNSTRKTNAK